jgi:hypothetical protein
MAGGEVCGYLEFYLGEGSTGNGLKSELPGSLGGWEGKLSHCSGMDEVSHGSRVYESFEGDGVFLLYGDR